MSEEIDKQIKEKIELSKNDENFAFVNWKTVSEDLEIYKDFEK